MRRAVLLAVTGAATVGFGTPALGEAPPGLVNHFSEDEFVCDGEAEMFSGEKTWPSRRGHEVTCTVHIMESSADGTFTGNFTVTAIPVR